MLFLSKKRNKTFIEIAFIVLLGLTPLLWFRNDQVILGHDAGLTLTPVSHFTDRLYAWTERYSFGNDQIYAIPGFFIHGLEALISALGANVQLEQKLTFIFWFILPGLTMYFFISKIAKKFDLSYFSLPASVFYMYNHFLLQGWFVAERTKFSLYAALPLLLAFLFTWKEHKRSSVLTAIYISFTFFFLNGMASLPLYGGIIIALITFTIFYFLEERSLASVHRLVKLSFYTGTISALINAYWLLAYSNFVHKSYSESVTFFGGIGGVLNWINYVSQNSSLINLLRLQGVPEWYQNPLHPYADIFLKNPLLVAISVTFPLMAFLPPLLYKEKKIAKTVFFFLLLALISPIFIAGAHAPFGSIYLLFVKFIPGFIAFRTPFYKFSPALWMAYSVLIALTINYIITKIISKKLLTGKILYFCFVLGIVFYSFPFLDGRFFDYMKNVRTMRINVPQYVYDFIAWNQSDERQSKRILMLPPVNPTSKIEAYTWGYWSLAPLSTLFSNSSIINDSAYLSLSEQYLIHDLYKFMSKNDPTAYKLAKLLNIDSFVMRNDFDWQLKEFPTSSPNEFKKFLNSNKISHIKTFGKWEVYDLIENNPIISQSPSFNYFDGESKNIGVLSGLIQDNSYPIYASSDYADNSEELLKKASTYSLKADCIMCNLQWKFVNPDEYALVFTRGSIFYNIIKPQQKAQTITGTQEDIKYLTDSSYRNILAFAKLLDKKSDETDIKLTANDFISDLNKLSHSLGIYFKEKNSNYNDELIYETNSLLRVGRIALVNSLENVSGKFGGYEIYSAIHDGITKIQNMQQELKNISDLPPAESIKNFTFASQISGQGTLFYKTNDPYVETIGLSDLNFTFENSKLPLVFSKTDVPGWYSAKINILEGKQRIYVDQPVHNLVTQTKNIKISSYENGGCYNFPKLTGETGDVYILTFKYKNIEGNEKFYIKLAPSEKIDQFYDASDELKTSQIPISYKNTYTLQTNKSYVVQICTKPTSTVDNFTPSSLELSDIRLYKSPVPELYIIINKDMQKNNFYRHENINYQKTNQTEYIIQKSTPAEILNFAQSFSTNWEINDKNSNHFKLNGYSNGWIISDSNVRINYKRQELVFLGFIISIASIIILLIFILSKVWRKK